MANEAENATKVIGKDRASEPLAIDQTRRLEDVLFLSGELLYTVGILQRNIVWVDVGGTLVNLKYFVGNVLSMTVNN